ncbi:MAG: hypothetical protein AAGD10_21205 [Myxococcota bacterium]
MRVWATIAVLVLGAACGSDEETPGAGLPNAERFARADGSACQVDLECASGTCVMVDGAEAGFCTRLGCTANGDCAAGSVCTLDPRIASRKCAPDCQSNADCDPGLTCLNMLNVPACLPPPPVPPMAATPSVPGGDPEPALTLSCQAATGPTELAFDIDEAVTSYIASPFTVDGSSLQVGNLSFPSGAVTRIGGTRSGIGAALLGFTSPVLVPFPGTPLQVESGRHELVVSATTDELCLLVVRQRGPTALALAINLYTVGVSIDGESLDVVLDTVRTAYQGAEIQPEIQTQISLDAPELEVIDNFDEIAEAVALTEVPSPPARALSINVVVTADFDIPDSGTIGVSSGIPGPAGLHGSGGSGVVMTGEFLGLGTATDPLAGARLTGSVMAHEMGHFLGLFHTTESDGTTTDAIPDSPNCVGQPLGPDCPDFTNVMFPSASLAATELSPGQDAVLQSNPLTGAP